MLRWKQNLSEIKIVLVFENISILPLYEQFSRIVRNFDRFLAV